MFHRSGRAIPHHLRPRLRPDYAVHRDSLLHHRGPRPHFGQELALAIITQFGLASLSASKRIVNAVIESIFNRIYDEVLKENPLYLEMSAVQLRRIVEILTIDDPDHGGNRR
jgi:hypothetical protein